MVDITNLQPVSKRHCMEQAERSIAKQAPTKSAHTRGNPAGAANARWTKKSATCTPSTPQPEVDRPVDTLKRIITHDKATFDKGLELINTYVERNISHEMLKSLVIKVFSTAINSWNMNILQAAQCAADVTGVAVYTARKWVATYYLSLVGMNTDNVDREFMNDLLSSERGRACGNGLVHDEEFRLRAREYVRENAYKKGQPNMTIKDFQDWIDSNYGLHVSIETARSWLHNIGFDQKSHHKAVYFDGHERDDVTQYRKVFVDRMFDLDRHCMYPGHTPDLHPGEKPLIQIHHDESTFYANADQAKYWSDGTINVLKQKSLGQAIMVSDFIEEYGSDYLRHNNQEARLLLETNTDGYFTNDLLMKQVDKAINIFEDKYPHAQALFLFDNAPSHKKYAEDALNADKMNVRPGGKQPKLRDTVFNGQVQSMILPDGQPKGMKLVLEERGVNTTGMNADKMRQALNTFDDFKNKITILEQHIHDRGHICVFIPKFHCELNAIERCWCHAKKHTRAYANGSITRLRTIVPEGLNTCKPELISKFFVTYRDYLTAYKEGHTCSDVDGAVKMYKSHRRVFNVEQ